MEPKAHKSVRVRFAPSPTGPFHLGSARTALFNWVFARQQNGTFILRIEDTDKERSKKEHEDGILESLRWLGLNWDEGPDVGGEYGPYRQSEREPIYEKYLKELLDSGKAYYCYCTKEELEAQKEAMIAQGLPPKYSGRCGNLPSPPAGRDPQLIRFRTPEVKVEFKDMIRGSVSFDASLFGDIPIARDLRSPLYNFAVVVDDELMGITHVIRGEDHLSNTPKQILFGRALGFKEPVYAHLPLILSADRSKLSKRYAETSLIEYEKQGYLPVAMINFLILLGWHPKDDREVFRIPELLEAFDIRRVQKAGAVWNEDKLSWLNSEHIRAMDDEALSEALKPLVAEKYGEVDGKFLVKIVGVQKERLRTLKEFVDIAGFFFELPQYEWGMLIWNKEPEEKIKEALKEAEAALQNIREEEFGKEKITDALSVVAEKFGRGAAFWPVRVALSGQKASPDPVSIAETLGKEESIRRIEKALKKLP
jgi:glutamyl-tRNA synthetase